MIKKKTIEDHLKNKSKEIVALFYELDSRISPLNRVEIKVTEPYIGYKFKISGKRPRLFVEVHVRNTKIEIHLRRGDYKNPFGISIKQAPDSHKWTLTKLVDISLDTDLDSVQGLIDQSYEFVR